MGFPLNVCLSKTMTLHTTTHVQPRFYSYIGISERTRLTLHTSWEENITPQNMVT